ncbi:hypothetical protein H0H93_006796 [Arthromyces matolae]|nr:hypothetical protein H0H93_006796 [Arthromyces matolae]
MSSSNQCPRTSSPLCFTADEKGKGRATFLSQDFDMKSIEGCTGGDSPQYRNPNKRKAVESPTESKLTKKNTSMANPPLHTLIRLSEVQEHPSMSSDAAPRPIPHTQRPSSPKTTHAQQPSSLPMERNIPTPDIMAGQSQTQTQEYTNIFAKLPSTQDIARAIELHIQQKPVFCGTEKEFNEKTMCFQELLNSVIVITQPGLNPPSQNYTAQFRFPPPPQRPSSIERHYARAESPTTPTLVPRRQPMTREHIPTYI